MSVRAIAIVRLPIAGRAGIVEFLADGGWHLHVAGHEPDGPESTWSLEKAMISGIAVVEAATPKIRQDVLDASDGPPSLA